MAPRVSVLMPTHNRSEVVGPAIESVLAQTEPDFELLVVGDGCTDDTADVVSAFGDPRIRFLDLPKAPFFGYANRNVALREARGDLIAFAAHDNLLFPDHLEQLARAIEASGAEWIYSRPLWVSTDGIVVPYCTNLENADELEWFLTVGNTIPATCVVHRRACLERYGYWPEDVPVAADWRYWIRIIEGGGRNRFAYVPIPTCLHFSAIWKHSRHSAVPEVWELLQIADASPWWPAVLRHSVPPGALEQQVIWAAMQAPGWSDRVRAASRIVIDRLAWDDIRTVRPHKTALEQQLGDMQDTHARRAAEASESTARMASETAGLRDALARARAEADEQRDERDRVRAERDVTRAECEAVRRERELAHDARNREVIMLNAARADCAALREALSEAQGTVEALRASTSWRITRPLRAIKNAMRTSGTFEGPPRRM